MKSLLSVLVLTVFLMSSCENYIQGPEDDRPPADLKIRATFTSIQNELFSPTCALSGCHGGAQNPNLSAGNSYSNLVNVASIGNPSLMRVKPFESQNSYLVKKLRGEGIQVMPPTGKLSPALIDSVVVWIDRGALNN